MLVFLGWLLGKWLSYLGGGGTLALIGAVALAGCVAATASFARRRA